MDLEGNESGTEILIHLISFNINEVEISSMKKGNAINSIGVFTESMGYAPHGNITAISRRDRTSPNSWGVMDNLTLTYDGNRLAGVSEAASDYDFTGSFEYKRPNGSLYMYDANGSLVADKSLGIAYVFHNAYNTPYGFTSPTAA